MVSSVTGKKKHFGILCSAREKCGNRTSEQAHKSEQWATEGKWKRVGQEQESSHWEKKKVFSHPGSLMIFFCVVQFHWQIHKANVTSDTSKMFHMKCHQLFYFLYNAAFFLYMFWTFIFGHFLHSSSNNQIGIFKVLKLKICFDIFITTMITDDSDS